MSYAELIVDTEVPKEDDIMHILPSKLNYYYMYLNNFFFFFILLFSNSNNFGVFASLK